MEVNIVNLHNENKGVIELNPLIFNVDHRYDILQMVVNWQLSKKRFGNHKTKGISDISGTTAKPYKQKHTGKARQGSLRSPQFRGGAVIFGPVVRDYSYSLNKKVRCLGLKSALSLKKSCNKLLILDNVDVNLKKTVELLRLFNNFNGYKSFLVIAEGYSEEISFACSNIYNINLLKQIGINVLDLLRHDCVMLTVGAVKYLEGRLL
ncbi:50S ribosomal protein L4 [Neoehrlichia mikurensis]|uniref:Large ribosomal subunit protein uL4 n=1 Tax=Neoehrlichia mikurensis TaxID=89586 RepID=A0A9Q9F446_9RICK|nr:50S ribosomal protein L4 [Neoehrlichia mikurensis]QXK91792.1 50S ribosomal protein L4 [Neoehrlichia mikurensis]QXK93005.1 50S ribosomal protein L4 [Neoehrlichia mikurensis]QXK93482.1 50S ribosomal protein L4 [Neoehrlichia mikurensis]UTO55563.1 50S ribosomal protein L4 [Neoehrlichia mikurensis]UTO56484.1 50S ribosomal protein L4 [Neoehrlichia mikurensis]